MKIICSILLTFLFGTAAAQTVPVREDQYLIVGTYDSPTSEGVYVYKFNSANGSAKEVSHIKSSNPSFLAVSPNKKYVYAVNENADSTGRGGSVTSFSFNKKNGVLTQLSRQSSEGNHPCYVSVDKTGRWVIAGNYSSGNFSVLPVLKNGMLGKASTVIQHAGSGPDTGRQKSPHVHAVYLKNGGSELYVPDLGIDKVMTYQLNTKTGTVVPSKLKYVQTDPGSGPRHIDFHPNGQYAYLMQELTATVSVYKSFANGDLQFIQRISSLPLTYKGPMSAADIHVSPDGKFLYCSNRDVSHTIAIYSINQLTGMITLVGHQSVMGEKPRNFNFDPSGTFLLVANQNTNEIVIFKRDLTTGLLSDTGNRIAVGKPVCLKWIPVK
jgi:6-phosphogluconolactonase